MSLTKFASFEVAQVLDIKGAPSRQHQASLDKLSDFENYRTDDGYLYCRIRAISSRVNKNHDGWPAVELAGSSDIFDRHHSAGGFTIEASEGTPEYGFRTFIGKPIFVDHHNSNPKEARGVIVDAKLNVLDHKTSAADNYWGGSDVDSEHLPPTEVELLLEVDAKSFPRLAKAIVSGDLDGFSMGCDVDHSKCSHCGHIASTPEEYCAHVVMKGAHHDYKTADGKRASKKSYENCYGIKFFEISAVFDPADETALAREVKAAVYKEADVLGPAGTQPDPLRGPQDKLTQQLAEGYIHRYQVDPDTAWQMAVQEARKQRPLPTPRGEGVEGDNLLMMKDYTPSDMQGMPGKGGLQGFPPPIRPNPGVPGAFLNSADDALNEQWPQRPVMNDPRWSKTHTAENPLPQEFMIRAPDELDTLRDEQLCPICGNDMDSETCQVCGYVQPPSEFDNPDLDKATEIRQEMKTQEEAQATNPQQTQMPTGQPGGAGGPGSPTPPAGMGGGMGGGASKAPATAKVTSEMHKWTPKLHPKTAARINQVERPVNASNPPQTDEPRGSITIKDQTKPVTSAMQRAQDLMATAMRNHTGDTMRTRTADGPQPAGGSETSPHQRVDVTGVGGVDVATNEQASKSHDDQNGKPDGAGFKQVDVTGIGGTGVEDVAADKTESLPTAGEKSDDAGFNTDKNIEGTPSKTFGDSDGSASGVGEPVTSEPFPRSEDGVKKGRNHWAYESGPLETLDQQGGDNGSLQSQSPSRGVQPISESFGERVDLTEPKTSPDNNSGPTTTWTGTDGNGVLKQQEPVTKEDQEWGGVKVPDVKLHTTGKVSVAALRLAEAEVELGLIDRQDKWNRMIEADQMHPAVVQAKLESYTTVKTAGLAKLATHRHAGVTRMPKGFQRIASDHKAAEEHPVSDESLDAGLFLR